MKIVVVLIVAMFVAACASENVEHIDSPREFELGVRSFSLRLDTNNDVVLLDVRQPEEYEQEHISNSILLPLGEISQKNLDRLGIGKNDEILLYCRSGSRSAKAYQLLTTLGYTNVKSLGGGIIHWKEDGMPVKSGRYEGPITGETGVPNDNGPIAYQSESEFDLGDVLQYGGVVSHVFSVTNNGKSDLIIGDISTSCGCTSAEIDVSVIPPGEFGTITVVFDPDLHEEPPGRFSRTIFVPTNDPNNEELEYRIWVDILEGK